MFSTITAIRVTFLCLVLVSTMDAFMAPFLHEAPTSWDDDVLESSRVRRDAITTTITPSLLSHRNVTSDHQRNSSSMFMVELFESLYTGHNLANPTSDECHAIESSDTIRSFTAHLQGTDPDSIEAVTWDVSFPTFSHPVDERVKLAEFRVHLNSNTTDSSLRLLMRLHQWVDAPCDDGTCRQRILVASKTIRAYHDDFDGREVFDVSDVIRKSLETGAAPTRFSIELRAKPNVDNTADHNKEVLKALLAADNAEDDHVDFDSSASIDQFRMLIEDVTLVVFSRAHTAPIIISDAITSRHTRVRRSSEEARKEKKNKELRKLQREQQKDRLAEKLRQEEEQAGPCRKVDMEVDFGRIGWDAWIIYPKEFNAFRCVGTCSGPLDSDDNPSNHAIMQDLIRMHQPERRTPEPCCVPTKLRPLSMLYYEEGAVLVRHHENMIVDECGCR